MKRVVIATAGGGDSFTFQLVVPYAATDGRAAGNDVIPVGTPLNAATANKVVDWLRRGDDEDESPQHNYTGLEITFNLSIFDNRGSAADYTAVRETKIAVREALAELQRAANVEQQPVVAVVATPKKGGEVILSVDDAVKKHALELQGKKVAEKATSVVLIDPYDTKDKGAPPPQELAPQRPPAPVQATAQAKSPSWFVSLISFRWLRRAKN